jgi:putative flippase GtrA
MGQNNATGWMMVKRERASGAVRDTVQKKDLKALVAQFVKFGMVGVSNTLVTLAVYYLFIIINPSWYLIGNAVGWILAIANSYFWNNKFVFKDSKHSTKRKLFRIYAANIGCFLLATILLYIEVQTLNISEFLAPILTLFITTPINFILNRLWVFKV